MVFCSYTGTLFPLHLLFIFNEFFRYPFFKKNWNCPSWHIDKGLKNCAQLLVCAMVHYLCPFLACCNCRYRLPLVLVLVFVFCFTCLQQSIFQTKLENFNLDPVFCGSEENVYLLCKKLCAIGVADPDGFDIFAVFISNEDKQASALWFSSPKVNFTLIDCCVIEVFALQLSYVHVIRCFLFVINVKVVFLT